MKNVFSTEVKAWARRAYRYDGMTTYEIARIVGASQATVFRWVNPISDRKYKKYWSELSPEKRGEISKRAEIKRGKADAARRSARRRCQVRSSKSWKIDDRREIREFYRNCPEGYEVDHIHPLSKGGSHRIENLQYLPRHENRVKSNKVIGVQL